MEIIDTIYVVALFIIFAAIMGFVFFSVKGLDERILNKAREWFGLPIQDLCVMLHFDEVSGDYTGAKIEDSSGYDNDGFLVDGNRGNTDLDRPPIWAIGTNVFIGTSALIFKCEPNACDDYVTIEENPDHLGRLSPKEGITIDLWVKLKADPDCDNIDDNNWRYLLSKGDDGPYQLILQDDWTIVFKIKVNNNEYELRSKNRLRWRTWTHLAATYDNSTGEMIIYVNAHQDIRDKWPPGEIESNDEDLRIGGWNFDFCPDGRGVPPVIMDEIRIYNKALSPYEIVAHFQAVY